MADYISKSEIMHKIRGVVPSSQDVDFIVGLIEEFPTLSETEIIRKTVERIVERLEEKALGGIGHPRWIPLELAIEIVKEECGISE